MIRVICREEPLGSSTPFVYKTFDVNHPELEGWLTGTPHTGPRCALGVEILPKKIPLLCDESPTPGTVVDAEYPDPEVDQNKQGSDLDQDRVTDGDGYF